MAIESEMSQQRSSAGSTITERRNSSLVSVFLVTVLYCLMRALGTGKMQRFKWRIAWFIALGTISAFVAGCATTSITTDSDVARSWDTALVSLHSQKTGYVYGMMANEGIRSRLAQIPTENRIPTVIFLHGSGGPGGGRWDEFFNRAGYAVISPNSTARKGYFRECDPQTYVCHGASRILRMRLQDVKYAAMQAQNLHWVDQNNLFLVGHSEGGYVAAAYRGTEFNAVVVSGTTCWAGIKAPSGTPVLSVRSAKDRWVVSYPDRCDHKGAWRNPALQSLIVPGAAHNVLVYKVARETVLDFLEANKRLR